MNALSYQNNKLKINNNQIFTAYNEWLFDEEIRKRKNLVVDFRPYPVAVKTDS